MASVQTRRMTDKERRYVEKELADEESRILTPFNAVRSFVKNLGYTAIVVGAIVTMIAGLANEIGFSPFALPIAMMGLIAAGLLLVTVAAAVVMTVYLYKSGISAYDPEDAEDARRALADGTVVEETHEIVAAKQVVMEDKDGLTYFLLTLDNRIFYWVDEESEDLWCDDKSIYDSTAKPRSRLIVTRTSVGDIDFDVRFEGAPVDYKSGLRFRKNGDDDLIDDDFVDAMPWDDVERRFTRSGH